MKDFNRIDFSRHGFDRYQINDIKILMMIEEPDWKEFVDTVGPEDARYGITLLETAALAVLDEETEDLTEFPLALEVIERVRHA